MPPKTITLQDYCAAFEEAIKDGDLENMDEAQCRALPVQVLFTSFEGTPIDFPVTGVGVKTDNRGQVIALVISCTQEGDFRAAAQNS